MLMEKGVMSNMKTDLQSQLRKIVNASGRMTKLGVSTQSEYVQEAILYGSNNYFDMDELYVKAGSYIAEMLEAEDAVVTSCASSGIVFTIAGLICGSNHRLIENLHIEKDDIKKREVIIPKGHSVDYGVPVHTMIELGGGKVVEAGNANKVTKLDVESYINENTIALFYVKSHHAVQKNMISIKEMVELSKKHEIPLIIDAAAEEDFKTYYKQGADFVVYSGAKALCGPSSGFVLCRSKEHSSNLRKQYYGIGRSMKIGKENIFGLVASIEEYYEVKKSIISMEDLQELVDKFNKVEGLSAVIAQDEVGREIYRCKLHVDEKAFGISGFDLNEKLKSGNPGIYCREHEVNLGNLSFDPRPLTSKQDLDLIYETVLKVGGKNEN